MKKRILVVVLVMFTLMSTFSYASEVGDIIFRDGTKFIAVDEGSDEGAFFFNEYGNYFVKVVEGKRVWLGGYEYEIDENGYAEMVVKKAGQTGGGADLANMLLGLVAPFMFAGETAVRSIFYWLGSIILFVILLFGFSKLTGRQKSDFYIVLGSFVLIVIIGIFGANVIEDVFYTSSVGNNIYVLSDILRI